MAFCEGINGVPSWWNKPRIQTSKAVDCSSAQMHTCIVIEAHVYNQWELAVLELEQNWVFYSLLHLVLDHKTCSCKVLNVTQLPGELSCRCNTASLMPRAAATHARQVSFIDFAAWGITTLRELHVLVWDTKNNSMWVIQAEPYIWRFLCIPHSSFCLV